MPFRGRGKQSLNGINLNVPARGAMAPVTAATFGKQTARALPRLGVTGQQLRTTGASMRGGVHLGSMSNMGAAAVARKGFSTSIPGKAAGLPRMGVTGRQVRDLRGMRTIGKRSRMGNRLPRLGRGKQALIGAALIGGGAIYNNTGRATTRTRGRPTGMYGF